MTIFPYIDTLVAKSNATTPINVCMHVLGSARTDVRVIREATALAEAGFELTIVDVVDGKNWQHEENIRNIRIKHTIMSNWHTPTHFKLWFLAKIAWITLQNTIRLVCTSADIYHAHDEDALPACYIAALLRRKPLIFDSHELPFNNPSIACRRYLSILAKYTLTRMLARCARVITTSPLYAQEICNQHHYPEVTLIRNFPTYQAVPKSDRLRHYLGLSSNVRIALYQGNLQPNRSLDILVHAAPFLEPDIVIVLMGKAVKATRDQLEALIACEGVADRVKIIPPVPYEELLNWTASADIGLTIFQPGYTRSIQLCLPNKLFEYLMVGLPVLSSQLDAIAEVIKTYNVGLLLPSLAPSDIGATINAMLADTSALARMRNNALEAAQQEFHWEKERQKLVQLYLAVLAR